MVAATSERELLAGLVRGEDDAFERLVAQYQDRLFNFVLRYTGRREDAEEVVQDAFLKAHRALCRRMTPERVLTLALTPWLYRVALNAARNHARRKALATTTLPEVEPDGALPLGERVAAGPEDAAERAAARRAIAAELARLPERYRAGVVLRFVEGLSYAEIAAVTSQPIGTVKSNVHRGLLLMRPGLALWWRNDGEVDHGLP